MLPYDVWYHYYDQPCDICEENIEWRAADPVWCKVCGKLVCEECRDEAHCDLCDEKMEKGGKLPDFCFEVCLDCMKTCDDCGVSFHPGCAAEHKTVCKPEDRAPGEPEETAENVAERCSNEA